MIDAAPGSDYRIEGLRLAREPHRYSGRTSMRADVGVHEPRPAQDPDTPFAFSMEGYSGFDRPRQQVAFAWAPGWNSPQAWNKFTDEVGGHLSGGDPGVRLIHRRPGHRDYASGIPTAPVTNDTLRALMLPCLFGGDETSARAEPIQQRMTPPVVILCHIDAEALDVHHGDTLVLGDGPAMTVQEQDDWPTGWAGLPEGLLPGLAQGEALTLSKPTGGDA